MAGLPAAARAGLVWTMCLLCVPAHRVRSVNVLAVGVGVHGGAGSIGRCGEGVLEVA
ncbi:hypothetical protein QWM81_20505 [Streptomyces ficellus]|uniref:Uncharacterized protein n=1 Tax=Streptomyces ficellus TaxID=1977088 RepID=A0ABT7ZA77_9ACTN|nr:hypothetical protein [Streptomyces ficellus]MDN3296400.1 hypothetical protein [Streptomyces ficellus]